MTEDQFKKLKAGDIVRHKQSSQGVIVTANYGGRVTAIRTHDLTQPHEWDLVLIAEYRDADDSQPQEMPKQASTGGEAVRCRSKLIGR